MIDKIKPMNIEKKEFECREVSFFQHTLDDFSDYQVSEPSRVVIYFYSEFSSTNVKLSLETLRIEVKPGVGAIF